MKPEYIETAWMEVHGPDEECGIKILVAANRPLGQLEVNDIRRTADALLGEIRAKTYSLDPVKISHAEAVRRDILGLFEQPIFVRTIPNGYCPRWCCRHLPWFVVTTSRGPITIGWRKRVISIDWSTSEVQSTADELFPEEDVTKSDRLIHAWSLADAKRYIQAVLSSPTVDQKR